MNEITFAFKCVMIFLFGASLIFFMTYFILANDHIVTLYLNPVYFNTDFYENKSGFLMPVWQFALLSFLIGGGLVYCVCQIRFYRQNIVIEKLSKENTVLKSKFEKVKTDVVKCVT